MTRHFDFYQVSARRNVPVAPPLFVKVRGKECRYDAGEREPWSCAYGRTKLLADLLKIIENNQRRRRR